MSGWTAGVWTRVRSTARGVRVLRPLAVRDFALLWSGMTVSLIGDGIYFVAVAWQVFALSNRPAALSMVGLAWMVPQVLLLVLGGALSDRFERRRVLMTADLVRGVAIGTLGLLAVTGSLRLWMVIVLVACFGVGSALFLPAFTGFVPELVPQELLSEANSLDQLVRPLAMTVLGPLLGGTIVATAGPGTAFLVDAGTFACSIAALGAIRTRLSPGGVNEGSLLHGVREGFGYVRREPWIWGILAATAVSLLCYFGAYQVLLPYEVKNRLGGGAGALGLVVAMGGVGAVAVSLVLAQRGTPRRAVAWICSCWALAAAAPIGFALSGAVWQVALVRLAGGAGMVGGQIAWQTLLHRRVPRHLIGRVSSLDWLVSASLIPVSYAIVGPVSQAVGVRASLLIAGSVGAAVYLLLPLLVPRVRSVESEPEPEPAARAGSA